MTDDQQTTLLYEYIEGTRDGPALDIACGTGRNAVFLSRQGYEVDALEQSVEGFRITKRTRQRGTSTTSELVAPNSDAVAQSNPETEWPLTRASNRN